MGKKNKFKPPKERRVVITLRSRWNKPFVMSTLETAQVIHRVRECHWAGTPSALRYYTRDDLYVPNMEWLCYRYPGKHFMLLSKAQAEDLIAGGEMRWCRSCIRIHDMGQPRHSRWF